MQLHLNRTTPQVHLNRQQPQPKSESGRKCNTQTSADVLSSSSPRQQRGRVPIMANSSIPPRNECPTGKRNQSSNNQTQNHSVCTTTRFNTDPPRNNTEAGKELTSYHQSQLERPPGPRTTKYRAHHNETGPQGSNSTKTRREHPHHWPNCPSRISIM